MSNVQDDVFKRVAGLSLEHYFEEHYPNARCNPTNSKPSYRYCPACGGSESGNAHAGIIDDKTFHCFRCGIDLTIITLAALILQMPAETPRERAYVCREILGGASSDQIVVRSSRNDQADPLILAKAQFAKRLFQLTRETWDDKVVDYLVMQRQIDREVVHEAWIRGNLGMLSADENTNQKWLVQHFGETKLLEIGAVKIQGKPSFLSFMPLLFFKSDLCSIEARIVTPPRQLVDKETGELNHGPKSLAFGRSSAPHYWAGKDPKKTMVCEGMIDLLSALTLGYEGDIISLQGAASFKRIWWRDLIKNRGTSLFEFALDNDVAQEQRTGFNPGQFAIANYKKAFDLEGIAMRNISPIQGDLNEYLVSKRTLVTDR